MTTVVGAYLCSRGAHFVEVEHGRKGFQVVRAFEHPGHLASAEDAGAHLAEGLRLHGVRRAAVAVVGRGFQLVHHTLSLPPARDSMLTPIVARELKRLEPDLTDPAIGWLPLPDDEHSADLPQQRSLLVGAIPAANAVAIEAALRAEGHTLHHLTVVPAAAQRLVEELGQDGAATAMLLPLPDGLFLGLFLGGGLRISIEPPLLEDEMPDGVAMAEEAELGATYVRQQFRGAQIERAIIAGPTELWPDTQSILAERLGVRVDRLDVGSLSTASLVALGGALDARAVAPLALAGSVANRKQLAARATLRQTAIAAIAATVIVAGWSLFQAFQARSADRELRVARSQVQQATATVEPLRQTAAQRRLIRDANLTLRLSARDRAELQAALTAISGGVVGPIRLDSLQLDRGSGGWVASLKGRAAGVTSGAAVQALHDFYRELPRRLLIEELALGEMAYADTTPANGTGALIRFELTFVIRERQD